MAALTPARKSLVFLLLAVLLGSIAWGGGILYWHLRLRSALRTFEEGLIPMRDGTDHEERNQRAIKILTQAGCRSLPYLADAVEESKDPLFLSLVTFTFSWETVFPGIPWAEVDSPELNQRLEAFYFKPEASSEERRVKCERLRAWWKEHGAEHHQLWRFWTARCRPMPPMDPREFVD